MNLNKNILLLEDDLKTRSVLINKLYGQKYVVYPVSTVNTALVEIQNQDIDLIILDIMLPGGANGFDFLEKIKKDDRYKNIPVIILTNLDTEQKVAMEIGVNEYLVKSNYSLTEIVDCVKKYLN